MNIQPETTRSEYQCWEVLVKSSQNKMLVLYISANHKEVEFPS